MGGVHIVAHRIASLEDTQSVHVTLYYDLPRRRQKPRLTGNSACGIRRAYMTEFNLILKKPLILHCSSSTPKREAAHTSKMLVNFYRLHGITFHIVVFCMLYYVRRGKGLILNIDNIMTALYAFSHFKFIHYIPYFTHIALQYSTTKLS
jgi:hypothetical protein